jgi:hypothetical protein
VSKQTAEKSAPFYIWIVIYKRLSTAVAVNFEDIKKYAEEE